MGRSSKAIAIVTLGLASASFSDNVDVSATVSDALDPVAFARSICGSSSPGSGLTRHLFIASAIAAPASRAESIPLYSDLIRSPFEVSTRDRGAQRYFSQGLLLTYGFNHSGAVRSFREAQRRDPGCAMCWWGEAVALGPNINAPMDERDRATALNAMDRAMALRQGASPRERALIEAVSVRYSRDPKADRGVLDAAYADAMLGVASRFPGDDDIAVLAAEAAMDTTPWNYWEADLKTPVSRIGQALRLVEGVVRRNPGQIQANHLYIHLLEASDPQRAEAAADRLSRSRVPSAAHLVHMPGHIYDRRGRHADAIRVNVAAARSDEAFIRRTGDRSLVRYGYYPHNIHFIVVSAQMGGDMRTVIREAGRLRTVLDPATSAKIGWIQVIEAAPYFAMAQFAEPGAILAMPQADERLPYAVAMRHYARAVAYAQLRDGAGFDRELASMAALRASSAFADIAGQGVPAPDLLLLAEAVARGRRAAADQRFDEAAARFREAIAIERRLAYMEPAFWYYPVQQSLGAALFRQGRYADASQAFRAALVQRPNNAWALYGLTQSEAALGHKAEAAAARRAFRRAWLGDRNWLRMDRL